MAAQTYVSAFAMLCFAGCTAQRDPARVYSAALAQFQHGDLPGAAAELDRFTSRWQTRPADIQMDRLRLLRSEVLLAEGKASDALQILDSPSTDTNLDIRRQIDRSDALAKSARVAEAQTLLTETSARAAASSEVDLVLRAGVLQAAFHARAGRWAEAEQIARETAARAKQSGDAYSEASALLNLSFSKLRRARFEDALTDARRALDVAQTIGADRIISGSYVNLLLCATQLGDFDRASEWARRGIELEERRQDWSNLQHSLGEAGNLRMLSGNPTEAAALYTRAHEIALKVNAPNDASTWANNLALAAIERADWAQAERWNREAERLKRTTGQDLSHVRLNDASIIAARGDLPLAEKTFRDVIGSAASDRSLLWNAQARLGRMLASAHRIPEAARQFEDALETIEDARTQISRDENRITFLAQLIRFYQDYVDLLVSNGQVVEALQVAESSRAKVLAARAGLRLTSDPRQAAHQYQTLARQTKRTVLAYWIAPRQSFLWVISGEGIRCVTLPPGAELRKLLTAFANAIENARDPLLFPELGARLYETLIASAKLPRGAQVVVVPDGPLHRINLETLPVMNAKPHYWIEDATVQVSPTVYAGLTAELPRAVKDGLLVGNPQEADPRFPKLPHAGEEIEAIHRLTGGATLIESAATPSAYIEAAPEHYAFLHIAAHAYANPNSPLDSSIVLSPDTSRFRLPAREILNHPLQAELVTLSACRSAGARTYAGEGMVGFAWAFLQAGAKSVVAGLWDVSDRSTSQLMTEFYKSMASGAPAVKALRDAKLSFIRGGSAWRKPYYWGTFQIYAGSTAPKNLPRR